MVWLGPESHDSKDAIGLAHDLCAMEDSPDEVNSWIGKESHGLNFAALVSLFERDYWCRLWVVQEILNAKHVTVCCGSETISLELLKKLVSLMERHEDKLRLCFPPGFVKGSRYRQSYAHVLVTEEPAQLDILGTLGETGTQTFLEMLRICRTKQTSDPRDKIFGLLGILPGELAIHAIPLGHVEIRGIAVGTFCGLDDSLMAFLHWRAKMLARFPDDGPAEASAKWTEQDDVFCRTISLGQRKAVWEDWKDDHVSGAWATVCYHAFATLIAERLPSIQVDDKCKLPFQLEAPELVMRH
ncbi:hypothetical protein PG987_008781 [Apiospora arundinis]